MITKTEIKKLSELARIEVSEKEMLDLQKDLEDILSYVDQLNRAETGSVELAGNASSQENIMREDNPEADSLAGDDTLLIDVAPASERGYVKVLPIWKR